MIYLLWNKRDVIGIMLLRCRYNKVYLIVFIYRIVYIFPIFPDEITITKEISLLLNNTNCFNKRKNKYPHRPKKINKKNW